MEKSSSLNAVKSNSDLSFEVESTLERLVAAYGRESRAGLYPTPDQWRTLLEFPYEGTLVTTQFGKMKNNFSDAQVQAAAAAYGEVTERLIPALGIEVLYEGSFGSILFGDDCDWSFVGMIRFPNRKALLSMFLDPDYIRVAKGKELMMERYRMVISYPPFEIPPVWERQRG